MRAGNEGRHLLFSKFHSQEFTFTSSHTRSLLAIKKNTFLFFSLFFLVRADRKYLHGRQIFSKQMFSGQLPPLSRRDVFFSLLGEWRVRKKSRLLIEKDANWTCIMPRISSL